VNASQLPEGSGIRISGSADPPQLRLELSLAPAPAENDEVVQGEDATVFLEDQLVALLDDKTLDTKIDGDQVSFTVVQAGPETGPQSMDGRPG
jgi:Fe-S cluster assembly iron-binding protein IscA